MQEKKADERTASPGGRFAVLSDFTGTDMTLIPLHRSTRRLRTSSNEGRRYKQCLSGWRSYSFTAPIAHQQGVVTTTVPNHNYAQPYIH